MAPDPQRRSSPHVQYNLLVLGLWEPLVECDPSTGQPLPAAAQSWSWSADRLTLTIGLRSDAYWSNGDPVTAQDFVRSWLRLLNQKRSGVEILTPVKNAAAYLQGTLKDERQLGVRAIDAHTLVVELEKPRPTFVMELSDPLLAPLHATTNEVLAKKTFYETPARLITNGPFRLTQANPDGYKLTRCERYHGRAELRLAEVQFVRADSQAIAQLMLSAGVIDLLVPTSPGKARSLPTNRPVEFASELEPTVNSIDFNVSRPPLGDVRVRRALALALDRTGPIEKLDPGHLTAAWSWVPAMPGRAGLKLLQEDADQARQLLAEAGYPGGRGFPVLRMALPLEPRPNRFALAWTERWFRELGVRTYVTYEYKKKHDSRMEAGDYDVLYNRLTATVPDAGDLLGRFMTPSIFNRTEWHDDEVTALLAEANVQTGTEHLALLEKAERRVMSELPSVPVMFEIRQTMLAREVRGWYSDPLSRQNLKRLYLEPGS